MILGGLALAFSRLIDNSVVVLENIFRHMELGETPRVASERGGTEVSLPVLAATFTTAIVFFPVTFLYGVSQFLFTALALAVVLSLFASYMVAMTVVPVFCANLIPGPLRSTRRCFAQTEKITKANVLVGGDDLISGSMRALPIFSTDTNEFWRFALVRPLLTVVVLLGLFVASLRSMPMGGARLFSSH